MKPFLHALIFFLLVMILSVITRAQNSLTHNTGTLEVTMIDNGYIGNDTSGTYGGVVFNGNPNALYIAGFIFGQYSQGYGNFYRILSDYYNLEPLAGFYSVPHFDQCADYTAGFALDQYHVSKIESFSNTGNDFVFLRINISNVFALTDDLYPGIFADWDVGDANLNRGGYDLQKNLFYTYESGGNTDTSFYGIMGIAVNNTPMAPYSMKGIVTSSTAWNRLEVYQFMTSTAFDTITADGDYRTFICTGPFTFNPGETLSMDLAIVAGTSLADLLVNADEAITYGQYIPVGVSEDKPVLFNYMLGQNYPNPFNPSTRIKYSLPHSSFILIKVFDVLGNEIETLVKEEIPAGTYELTWDAAKLPSGIYFYQLRAGEFIRTKKMILLK